MVTYSSRIGRNTSCTAQDHDGEFDRRSEEDIEVFDIARAGEVADRVADLAFPGIGELRAVERVVTGSGGR